MSAAAGPSKKTKTPKSASKKAPPAPAPVSASVVDSDSESEAGSASEVESEREDVPAATPVSSSKGRKSGLPRYQPPPGMEEISVSVSFKTSPMEFDALASKPGVELWAIRVPADLKASRLSSLTISKPKDDGVRGSLSTKSGSYVLEPAASEAGGAGAEMSGLSLMVPHLARGGKLYRAPVKISRRLLLTPVETAAGSTEYVAPLKRKREQPAHLLKFRSCTTGLETPGPEATVVAGGEAVDDEADEDTEMAVASPQKPASQAPASVSVSTPTPKKSKSDKEGKEKRKEKKSKGDADTPSSSKKRKSKE